MKPDLSNFDYGPFIRIFLRYVLSAVFTGAAVLGETLAADADFVMVVSAVLALLVEFVYVRARRQGKTT